MHSFNWIYAVDCQGKIVSSLNVVFLPQEDIKHVASSAMKSSYRLSNKTVVFCYYISLDIISSSMKI